MTAGEKSAAREGKFRIAIRQFGPFEEAIAQQWACFAAEHHPGLALDAVALDLGALEEALFARDGMRRGDWDVCFVPTDWIARMHRAGAAVDLAPPLAEQPPRDYPQGWSPSLLRLQRIRSDSSSAPAILGLPYHDGPECLIYRRDLFGNRAEQARFEKLHGRPLRPPATWDEFHQVARFFQSPQKGLYGAILAAYPDGHNSVYDFLLQLWTRGGELTAADGKVCLQTAAAREALSFLRAIVGDASAVHPRCRELDSVRAGEAFARGEAAMTVNWFGFAAHAHTAADSKIRGQVDIAEIPRGAAGSPCSLNVYWILSIAAGSPHRKTAWRFLRHCASPAMDRLTSTSGAVGCRRSTWSDKSVLAAAPFYRHMERLHRGAREIPQRADWPAIAAAIDSMAAAATGSAAPIPGILAAAEAQLAAR